jgi:hypothetical protein
MGVDFQYDSKENILHIRVKHKLTTREDVDHVIGKIKQQARAVGRPYFLTDLTGLNVEPDVSDYLGSQVKELTDKYALGIYRYSSSPYVRVVFRSQGISKGFKSNIYSSKDEALEALRASTPG